MNKRTLAAIAAVTGATAIGALLVFGDAEANGYPWSSQAQQNYNCYPDADDAPGWMMGRQGGRHMRGGYGPMGGGYGPMMGAYGPGMGGGYGPGPMMGYHGYHHMRGGFGPGMGGYGPMMGGGYGPMMGGGYGPGMGAGFGPGQMMALRADANHDGTLTADEVKTFLDVNTVPVRVDAKLGSVVEKDADTLTVTLVSPDGTTTLRSFDLPRKIQTAEAPRGWRGERMARRGGWDADDMPGRGAMNFTPGRELTVDDVKARVERRISRWNSDTVKIGEIAETDKGTITAQIVTNDGTVVRTMEFDKKTGRPVFAR